MIREAPAMSSSTSNLECYRPSVHRPIVVDFDVLPPTSSRTRVHGVQALQTGMDITNIEVVLGCSTATLHENTHD